MIESPLPDGESQPPQPGFMHRRDFVVGGIKVGVSMLVMDWLRMPAFAGEQHRTTILPVHLNDSINIIANYLTRYTPPVGDFPANGAWKASYDLLEWTGTPGKVPSTNRTIGNATITRRADAGAIGYDLDYTLRLYGWETGLKSSMQCSTGPIPGLVKWQTDYENHSMKGQPSSLALTENGEHRDGVLTISSKAGTRHFNTTRPVAPQWAILDAVRTAKPDPSDPVAGIEFDYLYDLTSYRPRQKLRPAGRLDISLDGTAHQFHGFIQTGIGSVPTHYWVDAAGRPLIFTGGLVCSGLASIQPA